MKTVFLVALIVCLAHLAPFAFAAPLDKREKGLPPFIESRLAPGQNVSTIVANQELDPSLILTPGEDEINELTIATILAATTYCRTVIPLGKWDCKHCGGPVKNFKLVKTFTSLILDANGMLMRDDANKTIYVVFRGSSSIRNFAEDLVYFYKSYPAVPSTNVHTGFYEGYESIQEKVVLAVLDQLDQYPDYKIIVTGHSLGGSYAVLHALDLYQRDSRITPDTLQIITQGQPRVGDPAFAAYVVSTNLRLRRVVHQTDPVPHLAPEAFGFLHSGPEYWITDSDDVQVCDWDYETNSCCNTAVPKLNPLDHLTYFDINTGLCL